MNTTMTVNAVARPRMWFLEGFVRLVLVLGVLLVGVGTAFVFTPSASISPGEAYRLHVATGGSADAGGIERFEGPVYPYVLGLAGSAFGSDVAILRGLSAAFFLLALVLMFLLGNFTYGYQTGLVGSLALALSPFVDQYITGIHYATLLLVLVLMNSLFFVAFLRNDRNLPVMIGFLATLVLGLGVHLFFIGIPLAQMLVLALRDRFRFGSMLPLGFVLLFFISATTFILAAERSLVDRFLRHMVSPDDVFLTLAQLFFGNQDRLVLLFVLSFWPLLLLAFLLMMQRKTTAHADETKYLSIATVFVALGSAYVSFLFNVFHPAAMLLVLAPFLYLLVAWALSLFPPRASYLASLLLVGVLGMSAYVQNVTAFDTGTRYQEAAAYVREHATARDLVLLADMRVRYAFEYHYRGWTSRALFPSMTERLIEDRDRRLAIDRGLLTQNDARDAALPYQRIFLVVDTARDPEGAQHFMDRSYERVAAARLDGNPAVFVYRVRYDPEGLELALSDLERQAALIEHEAEAEEPEVPTVEPQDRATPIREREPERVPEATSDQTGAEEFPDASVFSPAQPEPAGHQQDAWSARIRCMLEVVRAVQEGAPARSCEPGEPVQAVPDSEPVRERTTPPPVPGDGEVQVPTATSSVTATATVPTLSATTTATITATTVEPMF